MKTIREWFNELPEPYRSQALENMDDFKALGFTQSMGEAIHYGIKDDTQQGDYYWADVRDHYIIGSPLPEPWQPSFTLSDLEAEISNAMEWALNNARQSQTKGAFYLSDDIFGREPLSTAELLKIYQEQRNLEGKPL